MGLMTMMLAAGKAFIIALFLTPIFRDIFRAYNVVDRPGRRKVHAYPIPRVGGIPIVAGYLIALLQLPDAASGHAWALLPGIAAIFMTGLIDDFFNLRPLVKLTGQVGAGLLIYANNIRIEKLGDIPLPDWVSLPLTVFWLLLATNALNLIDGLDGLCAGIGFFGALALGVAGLIQDNAALSLVAFPLAGALLAFLLYNSHPATVFLGDSGALTIGFLLGCYGLIWTEQSTTVASSTVPLLAMAIPLLDVLISIVRRALKGHPLFGADRGHTHHRLLDRGLSVRQSAGVLYAVALAGGIFSVLLAWQPRAGGYHGSVIAGFFVVCGFGINQLRYPEFEATKTLLLGEFRRSVAAKARLGHLRETLARAGDPARWWDAVLKAGREEGFARLAWVRAPGETDDPGGSAEQAGWSFRIPLEDGSLVDIGGSAKTAAVDLTELAAILQSTYQTVRAREAQPAVAMGS